MLSDRLLKSQQLVRDQYDPNFSWIINSEPSLIHYKKKLSESKIALLTSCGFFRLDTQLPFNAWSHLGDSSFREIHKDTPKDRIGVAHAHYDHRYVNEDINVSLPIDRLEEFSQQQLIGSFYHWIYSFMGYNPEPRQLLLETVPILLKRLKADAVDAAIFTPC